MTTADRKAAAIAAILDNPVYTPSSGLIVALTKSLGSLSENALENLQLVISMKNTPPNVLACRDEEHWHAPSSAHPPTCAGCTSDPKRWGQRREESGS